ncbi:hypothetical protein [Myxococcus sp. AS-1-15]|uniref:hypothetical protein n=1 Tax=Myxococcus sp. AS-1-15 TaxID=2874600 RepID=UPI001CBDA917|nr:hypothetical protein [Myxococcus sp. AS-1-15]MBZ4402222.1 hypothetical protein [Myxococcus sp. AS-1-15]
MRGSSSPEPSPWWEIPLDWPVEHVPCQLEVVEPRRLTALEWAVLRVLEAFGDAPPSLEEMAEELGLGEPRFLAAVLRALLSQEALHPRPGANEATGLGEVLFTERGLELFRKGQVDGAPSTQGYGLCFDAITDESLPVNTHGRSDPGCPAIDPSELPEPREEVGLERLRTIVQRLGPPVGGADALIRTVRVLSRGEAGKIRSGFSWVTHPLTLVPTPEGGFRLHTPSLTPQQREWLMAYSLEEWVTPARAVTHEWAPHPPFLRRGQPLKRWSASAERLVPISKAEQEAKRLVATARREVLLHAAWAAAPGIADALTAAASRGVAIYVLGAAATGVKAWSAAPQRAPGFVIEAMHPDEAPGALVVDGREALLLDEVRAEVEDLGTYSFEVVGGIHNRAATVGAELRRALLDALPSPRLGTHPPLDVRQAPPTEAAVPRLMAEPQLRLDLARLVLHPTPEGWSGIEAWLATRCLGADRVAAIQQVADLTGPLLPDATPAPWRSAGATAWQAFHQAILAAGPQVVPDDVLRALIRLAPPETAPEAVLEPLVAQWVHPEPAIQSVEALSLLGRLRTLMDGRWQGAPVRCPGFIAALERCLEVIPPPPDEQSVAGLARLVATVAPADRAQRWAWAVVALWPAPLQLEDFGEWRRRHEPLGALLGPALNTHHAGQWKALIAATPARTEEQLSEQLRMSQGLLAAPVAVASILALPVSDDLLPQAERLILLRSASRSVWKQGALNDETWNRHLQALLGIPPQGYSTEVHGPLLSELSRRLQGWPGAGSVLRAWAQALVGTLPPPVLVEGLVWWLESLRGVAGTLGPDLQRTASTALARHMGALRDARQRTAPLWEQVIEAWQGLGLARTSLEALVEPPVAPAASASKPNKQGKKGKKR